jgi:hypothetical protein
MSVVEGKADFQLRIQTSEFDPERTLRLLGLGQKSKY